MSALRYPSRSSEDLSPVVVEVWVQHMKLPVVKPLPDTLVGKITIDHPGAEPTR